MSAAAAAARLPRRPWSWPRPLGVAFAAVAMWACGAAHRALTAYDAASPLPALWAPPALVRAAACGHRVAVADGYWLAAIAHFGDRTMHAAGYPLLAPLLARVVHLDPDFAAAYVFAGTVLTVNGMDPQPAIALLQAGARRRGDDWRIPFLLGFNAYYFAHDDALAAAALAQAARVPGVPAHVGLLATRLAARSGTPEVGLALIEAMVATAGDAQIAAPYLARRQQLQLEVDLRRLQRAVDAYRRQTGTWPPDLAALPRAKLIDAVPADPFGGAYRLDARGRVHTDHDADRLAPPHADRH